MIYLLKCINDSNGKNAYVKLNNYYFSTEKIMKYDADFYNLLKDDMFPSIGMFASRFEVKDTAQCNNLINLVLYGDD